MKKFVKHNQGKTEWHLLPMWVMEYVVRVLMHGAIKYSSDNWKLCKNPDTYFDACVRHLNRYQQGRLIDPDSGLPHLSHAICCLIFQLGLDILNKRIK